MIRVKLVREQDLPDLLPLLRAFYDIYQAGQLDAGQRRLGKLNSRELILGDAEVIVSVIA